MTDLINCKCGGRATFRPDNLHSNDHREIHAAHVRCSKCGKEGPFAVDNGSDHWKKAKDGWNLLMAENKPTPADGDE